MQVEIKNAVATLKNVNLRTENNGDERVLACDLKVEALVEAEDVRALFLDSPHFMDSLWDEKNQLLNHDLEIRVRTPIENCELRIDDLAPLKGCRVKKGMILLPRNARMFLFTGTVQLSGVGDVRPLAKRLHENVKVTIIESQLPLTEEPVTSVAA